jgi:hypothetical protein|tara:strand:- start:10531 stop:11055 length:525 start_codon:yes stop_codon:yes gene_type:complete
MFNNKNMISATAFMGFLLAAPAGIAQADETPINGTVQSRCIIQTDVSGTYGNPNAYTLTTSASDGGENAVIRIDVSLADAYYAEITAPQSFTSSPILPDQVTWTGDTIVKTVSDATAMGAYETSKIELGMMDRYDLTATGSTWFETSSVAAMGGTKAFPGGNYTALVLAECIAQ